MTFRSAPRFYAYLIVVLATATITIPNPAQIPMRAGAENSAAPTRHADVRDAQQFRGTLTVSHSNAWEAQRQLEARLTLVRSLIDVQGGTLRLDAVRYRRERNAANSASDETRFEIDQEITITLPRSVNWAQFKADLARLSP